MLVAGESRRGSGQLSGRDPYHRVVNFLPAGQAPAPGASVRVKIVEATPHSLIGECLEADSPDTISDVAGAPAGTAATSGRGAVAVSGAGPGAG